MATTLYLYAAQTGAALDAAFNPAPLRIPASQSYPWVDQNEDFYFFALNTTTTDVASEFTNSLSTQGAAITAPGYVHKRIWVSPPVSSSVQISGSISYQIGAYESSMSANIGLRVTVWVLRPDGTTSLVGEQFYGSELTTTMSGNAGTITTTTTQLYVGDCLVVVVYYDDAGGTPNSGSAFYVREGSASDTISTTETLSLISSAPSGTVLNLQTDSSTISGGRKAWTGTSTSSVTHTMTTGSTYLEAFTTSNGSSPLVWYTQPLTAVTIEGVVKGTFRISSASNSRAWAVKIFKTDQDGSNPVSVGTIRAHSNNPTTEASQSAHGTIRATLTNGQRLKYELYTTSPNGVSAPQQTMSVITGSSSGECQITLPVSVTEYSSGPTGTASLSLSGSISTTTAPVTATGSLALSGSAPAGGKLNSGATGSLAMTGSTPAMATATGSVALTGSANWRLSSSPTASIALSGSAPAGAQSTATGTLALSGSAPAGGKINSGASASLALSGSAPAQALLSSGASGSLGLSGTVNMGVSATGSLSLSGAATAQAPATATGSLTLTGTGNWSVVSGITGSVSLTGSAAWRAPPATGSISLTGTANWTNAATGSIGLSGTVNAAGRVGSGITGSLTLGGSVQSTEVNATFTTVTGQATAQGDATNFTATVPAFAAVRSSTTTVNDSNSTSHTVTLPASITSSDLILLFAGHDGTGGTVTEPSGFSVVLADSDYSSGDNGMAVFGKVAVGSEGGTTVTWTTSNAEMSSTVAVVVRDWGGLLNGLVVSAVASNSVNPIDPPALNTGVTSDWLFLTAAGWDGNRTISGVPAGYTTVAAAQSSSPNGTGVTVAYRQTNTSSENPGGGWSLSTDDTWVAVTVAVTTGAGNARFSTGYATAIAYGDVNNVQGEALWSTVEGDAPASGGLSTFLNLTTFYATGAGAATSGGGTTTTTGDAAFTTLESTCTAGGEDTTFFGQQSVTWETSTADAIGYGELASFVIPVNVTFDATGSDAAVGTPVGADDWFTGSTFTTLAGSANGSTTGTGVFKGDAKLSTTTTGATADGNAGSLLSDRYTWTTLAGSATADGRTSGFTSAVNTLLTKPQEALTGASLLLAPDPFQAFVPERVNSTVATFSVEDWRVVDGLPKKEAWYAAVETAEASLGASSVSSPFVDPSQVSGISFHRWLASSYTTPDWTPITAGAPTAGSRSWDQARESFTWSTARLRTWDQLRTSSADPSTPLWQNYGTGNATKSTTYTYWRVNQYVSNNAVLVKPGNAMQMIWNPNVSYPQITVALVLVPRVPTTSSYELLSANSNLRVVLNSDSTIAVVQGSELTSLPAISARSRPNEPIVVALSVQTNEPGSDVTWWRYHLAVMDTMVRTTTKQVSGTLSQSDLDWRIGRNLDANFELLEANVYTDAMSSDVLAHELSVFDMIYGVTIV